MNDNQPQKPKIIDAENIEVNFDFEITHYKMDENGNYTHGLLANWGNKEIVNNQSWDIVKERIKDAKERALNGESSPIAYYMEKCITDVATLSQYVGIAKWRIKRHLKPDVFKKLSDKILNKYADFFQITIEELKDINYKKN